MNPPTAAASERAQPERPADPVRRRRSFATASLAALVAGIIIGLITFETRHPLLLRGAAVLEPIGSLWVDALRMVVLPLIVSHLFVAIAAAPAGRKAGRIGALSLVGFVGLLVLAAIFTLTFAPPFIGSIDVNDAARAALRANAGMETAPAPAASAGGITTFFTGLIPDNPVQAAADGAILPVLLFTAIFALATLRVPVDQRVAAVRLFQGLASASRIVVGWLLLALPVGVFAIAYALTAATGFEAAGIVGAFVLLVCGFLIAYTLLLYPLVAWLGRVPIRRFARAAAAAQTVAAGTRSSLATLPVLIESADQRLGLEPTTSAVVLPLAVATFKVNRCVSSPIKLLLLAHVYGLAIEPGFLVVFIGTVILLSFSSPGIPGGGAMVTTPVYLAAGIPLEGILLLEAADPVNDVFKTVANVTADLSVAAIVGRWIGAPVIPPVDGSHTEATEAAGEALVTG